MAVIEVVIARDVGVVITDIAEEGAERPVVVERQRQRAQLAACRLHDDRHVHRDAEVRVHGTLDAVNLRDHFAGLVHEQVDGMAGMVPQEMIGPASWAAVRADVLAAEEIGLNVHLLDRKLSGSDQIVNILVRRVEAPDMARHRDKTGFLLFRHQRFGVGEAVGHRDLDQDMLAGIHGGKALFGMHSCRRGENDSVDAVHGEAFRQIGTGMRNAVFRRQLPCRFEASADHGCYIDTFDQLQRVQMFLSEGAAAGKTDFHEVVSVTFWL